MTYRKMKELALTDEKIAARLKVFDHRVREEFYDYENDPDGLTNLIDDPKYAGEIRRHRKALEEWMVKYNDHMLEVFQKRSDNDVVEAYMAKVEKESAERRKGRKPKKGRAKKKKTAE
jgi:N-sulfoglucosamine sulfohydrolase